MYSKFTVEGAKPVQELLQSSYEVEAVYAVKEWLNTHSPLFPKTVFEEISASDLARISSLSTPNQVLAVAGIPAPAPPASGQLEYLTLLLDGINDPGNLGTIIRIADWFGVRHIFCGADTVDAYNPKTVQAAMGSLFRVQLHYTDLQAVMAQHTELPCYAAVLDGENVFEATLSPPALLLLGSEAHGIRPELLSPTTRPVSIPGSGRAESLNVAVAAGILCGEFFKRQ